MKILVIGANGATGRLVVEELLARRQDVTVFVRRPEFWPQKPVRVLCGDAMHQDDVTAAVEQQDAVVVVLGIRENPLLVRIRGSRSTPINVRSQGTRNVVEAMRCLSIRRLVVQSTFGTGDTWNRLSFQWKVVFSVLLRPQIDDSERQEQIVKSSDLDWTIIRPVALTDAPDTNPPLVSAVGQTRSMRVPRRSVARVLAEAVTTSACLRQCAAVSA